MDKISKLSIKLPLIGPTLIWELVLLTIFCVLSAVGVFMCVGLLPSLQQMFMPGSGGTAQMIGLTILGPMFISFAFIVLLGICCSYALLRKVYRRSAK
jgi:hypothetical protein